MTEVNLNKDEPQNFYPAVCPRCQGQGCPACGDFNLLYWYTDLDPQEPDTYTLYWGKEIDWLHIVQRHLENIIKKGMNLALIIFGVSGILLGAWAYLSLFLSPNFLNLTFDPVFSIKFQDSALWPKDYRTFLFWLSFLTDFYLYYRLERARSQITQVLKKVFKETGVSIDRNNLPIAPTWPELYRPQAKKIDISETFTEDAIKAIEQAWRIAKNWHHGEVLPIHLLAGLFSSQKLSIVFGRLGTDWDKLTQGVKKSLGKVSAGEGDPVLSLELKNAFFEAYEQAYVTRQEQVSAAELLVALDMEKSLASQVLYELEIEPDKIKNVAVWLHINERLRQQWGRYHSLGRRRPKGEVNKAYTAVMTPYLDAFSTDLTREAAYGYYPPIVDREKELDEIFRIIQGGEGSVLLVGFSGVGKSAIIEEIAQRMIADDVPRVMQDKRLISLSIAKITAGATPAEANERLLTIFDEMVRSGNIILIIESIHGLVGITAGSKESLDLSEALANYLAKTNSIAIATTTPEDYNYLETAGTLTGHFHRVNVDEPEGNLAIQMVEGRVGGIEGKNNIYFSYDAIAKVVELTSNFLPDRYLPAKAIEILKEVAVYASKNKGKNKAVTAEDVATIISQKTNIPLTKISESESEKLVSLDQEMHERMIGQDEAVQEVASALRRARAGMRDPSRPIANFLFLGPTGVGKTELAKTVAAVYFGSEERMIRLDMSEYQTKESLYRLIGAPEGDKTGGYLTQAVRQSPFSLLLFDEIEKAHPDILNVFLQVMDDGRLTDNAGRTVDFSNCIIIMTSNAGTSYIQEQVKLGRGVDDIKKDLMGGLLNQFFRPEFLNRFDAINVFKPLSMAEVTQIANLMIKKTAKTLLNEGVVLEVTSAAISELAEAGFDPEFGARPLRRVVQERLDNALANMKIQNKLRRGDKITFDVGGKITVSSGQLTR